MHFRPGCISSSEFFHHLHKRLELGERMGRPITRLVFWDLTQLEYRFPLLANDQLFIPALIDYLKNARAERKKARAQQESPPAKRKKARAQQESPPAEKRSVKSVFMGAANTQLAWAASAIADNVVFSWRDRYQGPNPFDEPTKWYPDESQTNTLGGFAFHVDRREGHPESGSLFFLPEGSLQQQASGDRRQCKEAEGKDTQSRLIGKIKETDEIIAKFDYAGSMRERIWAMQGLEVSKQQGS